MDYAEFKEAVKQTHRDRVTAEKKLIAKYCEANRKYNFGDYIQDQSCVIKVDKWYFTKCFGGEPDTVYCGVRVRKSDLAPVKSGVYEEIYQSNVKQKIESK